MPDKAMVFAAGLGTRMRPITDTIPKPLVEVAGKPLIDHMLDRFAETGLETAVVNVHHHADRLEAHLATRQTPKIVISDERTKLLDQGGGIRKALPILGAAPFFLCNTDAFWVEGPQANLSRLSAAWDPEKMDILLLVAATSASVGVDWPGDFTMDAFGRLTGREERRVAPFVYTGVGIIKPELFKDATEEVFRLAPFFHRAAAAGKLFGVRLDGLWFHVGTPQAIDEAERTVARSIL
ncbi:nucleotidyltransferase family protein [Methylovirgula sp. HY1]|uniref:nucleotidyltransferase family protein n=1 Tax=Methylovirgula sp. HY1 TaxID=2822761 RepID=UPI001C75C73D|nr:nucleotidyltransferase family protein [Methylovirgula sp. HY1]QXX76316.1 UTP--glucose-1-phosphate uridylyltransferase [Methylovirgula sp. HY1]